MFGERELVLPSGIFWLQYNCGTSTTSWRPHERQRVQSPSQSFHLFQLWEQPKEQCLNNKEQCLICSERNGDSFWHPSLSCSSLAWWDSEQEHCHSAGVPAFDDKITPRAPSKPYKVFFIDRLTKNGFGGYRWCISRRKMEQSWNSRETCFHLYILSGSPIFTYDYL